MSDSSVPARALTRVSRTALGLLWALPFLQPLHRYPLTSFYSEWLAFALGLIALLHFVRPDAWRGLRLPVVALTPLLLGVVVLMQLARGQPPYAGQGLAALLYLIWAAALVVLSHSLTRIYGLHGMCLTCARWLLAGVLASAFVGLLQHFEAHTLLDILVDRKQSDALIGNTGQSNHYGHYLMLGMLAVAYLRARGAQSAGMATGWAMLLLIAAVLSGSRSVLVYLIGVLVLTWWWRRRCPDATGLRLLQMMAALLVGFMAMQYVLELPLFASPAEHTTVTERLVAEAAAPSARLELWGAALRLFLEAPLAGAGWGQFSWSHFEYQSTVGIVNRDMPFTHAHNLVLQLLAETGLIGASVVAAGLLLWLRRQCRADAVLERWWLLALVTVTGVHSLLEFPLWYAHFLGIFGCVLGMAETRAAGSVTPLVGARAAILLLAGAAIVAGSLLDAYVRLEPVYTPRGAGLSAPEAALRIHQAARDPVLRPYAESAAAVSLAINDSAVDEKLQLTARAMHFLPAAAVVYRHALLLATIGEAARAKALFHQALRVYPEEGRALLPELAVLVGRYPGRYAPLLELASAELRRAP